MFLPIGLRRHSQRNGVLLLAAAAFAAGLSAGAWLAPMAAGRSIAPPAPVARAAPEILRTGYPAELLRVIDGDTFEARIRIWPGQDVTTRVRLRGIDAPEMKARCDEERAKALMARDYLTRLLNDGALTVTQVGLDKYGGRIDADASTARTSDIGTAMLDAGLARPYGGGKRQTWCDERR